MDSTCRDATDSIAALLQPDERHGAEMDAAGAPRRCSVLADGGVTLAPARSTRGWTSRAVVENSSKRKKEDDATRELMEGAAKKAVGDVMLTPHSCCSTA